MSVDYGQLIAKTLRDFRSNLVLIPLLILLSFASGILLVLVFGLEMALGTLLFGKALFTSAALAYWIPIALADAVIFLAIISYANAAQYGIIADAVTGKKVSLQSMLKRGRENFRNMLTFLLAAFLLVIIALYAPLIVAFLFIAAAFMASPAAGIIAAIVLGLLYLAFLIAVYMFTIFTLPLLIARKMGGFKVIMEAIRYSRAHLGHAAITLVLVIAFGIASFIVQMAIRMPSYVATGAQAHMGAAPLAVFWLSYILSMIAGIVLGLVITLFVFNAYYAAAKKH